MCKKVRKVLGDITGIKPKRDAEKAAQQAAAQQKAAADKQKAEIDASNAQKADLKKRRLSGLGQGGKTGVDIEDDLGTGGVNRRSLRRSI